MAHQPKVRWSLSVAVVLLALLISAVAFVHAVTAIVFVAVVILLVVAVNFARRRAH